MYTNFYLHIQHFHNFSQAFSSFTIFITGQQSQGPSTQPNRRLSIDDIQTAIESAAALNVEMNGSDSDLPVENSDPLAAIRSVNLKVQPQVQRKPEFPIDTSPCTSRSISLPEHTPADENHDESEIGLELGT